jgi:hypothetical protein
VKTRFVLVSSILALVLPAAAAGWGGDVHRLINRSAVQCLPAEFAAFGRWAHDLERLSTHADARKSSDPLESMRHYIDIDDYPEFFLGTMPHGLEDMIALYGRTRVEGNGIAPWAIEAAYDNLVFEFEAGNWSRAVEIAADIGHYVGDLHNPLHNTLNFDGQLTGQYGIHSRFESRMTSRYLAWLAPSIRTADVVPAPPGIVFDWIDEVYPGVQMILAADLVARAQAGGSTDGDVYYEALWIELGPITDRWIGLATVSVASLWYSAWMEAGAPPLPGTTVAETISVGRLKTRFAAGDAGRHRR